MIGWGNKVWSSLRRLCAGAALVALLLTGQAWAQIESGSGSLVPADFFNAPADPKAPATIAADALSFDATTGVVTATGDVEFGLGGYSISGQKLVFNRRTNAVHFEGGVVIRDPSGNTAKTENLDVTGGMQKALVQAFTITSYDGARITADSVDYDAALQTLLTNPTYSPCGDCIDAKGRRIGWSVRAARITSNAVDGSLYIEQPQLSVLGIPIAYLPFLYLPDTSNTALANVQMPGVDYSDKTGLMLRVPYRAFSSRNTDIIFTPTLLSRQGFLLGAEWVQRFDQGGFSIKASGLRQFDQGAFAGTVGDREWRGAIQSAGSFRPVQDWTVGWSYTAFTDAQYLGDYKLDTSNDAVTQVYATKVTPDTYIDARVQTFNQLGNVTAAQQGLQGQNLPVIQFNHLAQLGDGRGQIDFSGHLLGIHRDFDSTALVNGIGYVQGYAGNKVHATFEAGWRDQFIGGGFVATPYLGGRADVAYYDGTSPLLPGANTLWSATPIAAMDVRFPLSASDGATVHLVEPIAQLVYRGSADTAPGYTNDNAQSFVFDDTNLFSYNRFSGTDRQETGLRANLGGQYLLSFADGGYLSLIGGESIQLAGVNAFAAGDAYNTGVASGLDSNVSYAVLGAYGSLPSGIAAGGKVQVDTATMTAKRAGLGANFGRDGYSASLSYLYIAAAPTLGVLSDQHEIGAEVGVPVADYWTARASTYWDLSARTWLQAGAGLQYDDGYLAYGAAVTRTGPTNTTPNDTRFVASFRIKAPAGFAVGYTRQ